MDEATGNAGNEELVVDEELNDRVELLLALSKHSVELLGLWNGTGETVKNEALMYRAKRVGQRVPCQRFDDV